MTSISRFLTLLLVLFGAALLPMAASAQSAQLLFEGYLTDDDGPANGERELTFRLYEAAQGGAAIWEDTYQITVEEGRFQVPLGSGQTPLTGELFSVSTWLGITPAGGDEFEPRQPIGDVPTALVARDVTGDINPRSISINGQLIVAADGTWVGAGGLEGAGFGVADDRDNDGWPDWVEVATGSDPTDEASQPADANEDGAADLLQGPTGPMGAVGTPGVDGLPGDEGARGPRGEIGDRGPAGPVGPEGSVGPRGDPGERGQRGEIGEVGPQGIPGPAGPQGIAGPLGPQGERGPVGPQGEQGIEGPVGPAGLRGERGPEGPAMDVNQDSDQDGFPDWIEISLGSDPLAVDSTPVDLNDNQIPDAMEGTAGPAGVAGPAGPAGAMGPAGPAGAEGVAGADGAPGVDGAAGPAGADGAQGPAGPAGDSALAHINPNVLTSRLTRTFAAVDVPIVDPQDGNPVESLIDVPGTGPLNAVKVTVDITHGDLTQLNLKLRAPDGTIVTLHANAAGQDLALAYPTDAQPADGSMDDFLAGGARGNWALIMTDNIIGNVGRINGWSLELTYTSGDQLDLLGNIDMSGNTIMNTADPIAPQQVATKAYVDRTREAYSGARYRWAVWSSYNQPQGWYASNDANLFGGINPSNWGDGSAIASQLSADKQVLLTLFNRRGFAGKNAMVVADEWYSNSSTNSKHAGALFRIRNTTNAAIEWVVNARQTSYGGWGERASVALNGVSIWHSGGTNYYTNATFTHRLSIPANRTSTAIFISGSTSQSGTRGLLLAFYSNSLELPAGLEYVDDLDTATNGWDN